MSPPAERIWLMAVWSTPPVRDRLPSQAGVQPPESSTKAIVNHLMPVALITVDGLGGSPQPSYRYGAGCLKDVPPPLPAFVVTVTELEAAEVFPAASRAFTVKVYDVLGDSPLTVADVPEALRT